MLGEPLVCELIFTFVWLNIIIIATLSICFSKIILRKVIYKNQLNQKLNNYQSAQMVLGRQPKKYRHFIKILTSQLMIHEHIVTTSAKAKHLRKAGNRLLCYARRAANGQKSATNLLQGRVSTEKVHKKLLLNLIPRLRSIQGGDLVRVSSIQNRRKGDNAPMVTVSIVGDEKSEFKKNQKQTLINNGTIIDIKTINKKWLLEEKTHYESVIAQRPHLEQLLRPKINRIDFEIWTETKTKREPPRYTLLV